MEIFIKIFENLECNIGDVCEFVKDEEIKNAQNQRANIIQYAPSPFQRHKDRSDA